MALRRDALAAAAEMVLAVEREGLAMEDLVATVGKIEAQAWGGQRRAGRGPFYSGRSGAVRCGPQGGLRGAR
jgi:hypothetical protein